MSFIMKRFFVFVLGLSCMSIISLLAVEENPLIKRELFLISNSGFENNLENWGGEYSDRFETALGSDGKTTCRITKTAIEGGKALSISMDEFIKPGSLHVSREFKV